MSNEAYCPLIRTDCMKACVFRRPLCERETNDRIDFGGVVGYAGPVTGEDGGWDVCGLARAAAALEEAGLRLASAFGLKHDSDGTFPDYALRTAPVDPEEYQKEE